MKDTRCISRKRSGPLLPPRELPRRSGHPLHFTAGFGAGGFSLDGGTNPLIRMYVTMFP